MILLTTAENKKIIIKINHITSMSEQGNKTHIKIKGIDEKFVVLESIDEIRSLLQVAGRVIVGSSYKPTAELFSLAIDN